MSLRDSPSVAFHDLRPLHAMLAPELAEAFNRVVSAGRAVGLGEKGYDRAAGAGPCR